MKISERIKHLRERQHMLQKELADKAGVAPETVSQWENEERIPSLKRLPRIAQALGVNEIELMTSNPLVSLFSRLGYSPDHLNALTDQDWLTLRTIIEPVLRGLLAERTQPPPPPRRSAASSATSVFIVDDEAKLCYLMKRFLEAKGFSVEYAFDGKAALQRLLAEGWTPGVILLDLKMPEMDGISFLKRLRKINTRSKVIIWSAYPEDLSQLDTSGLGYEALYEKPVQLPVIAAKIEELLCPLPPEPPHAPNGAARSGDR